MNRLLSADFYCLRKSKLSWVMLIIAAVMPIGTVLLYVGLRFLAEQTNDGSFNALSAMFTTRGILSSAFSLTNNIGIIFPIFAGIIIGSDMTNGTLRNKVIIGHSKAKIYFSHLIVCVIFGIVTILLSAIVTILFSLIFFQYGVDFNGAEIKNLVYFFVTGLLAYVFVSSVVNAFALIFKTPAPTILISILVGMGFGLIASLIAMIDYSSFKYLVYLIPTFANTQFVGGIEDVVFIEGSISLVVFSIAFIFLGLGLFTKKDIK